MCVSPRDEANLIFSPGAPPGACTSSLHAMAVSATSEAPAATASGSKWPKLWEGQTLKGDAAQAADPSASW